jgi:MFS family permease
MTKSGPRHEKLLLTVIGGVVFLDTLDLSLVQVALPSIGSALHLAESRLQWVVSAFVLGYGGFLLLGGRCADVLGRRRVLVAGLVALAGASALGTVASDGTLLIVTRFVKGVSAAFTAPAALSILTTSFAEGQRRNRALGLYAAGAAAGFTFGLVAGGLLTELSWRLTFAFVTPVALALLFVARRIIEPDLKTENDRGRLDMVGAVLVTAAMLVLVHALVVAPDAGWLSAETLCSLAVVALLMACFVRVERRVEHPLVRLGILRSGRLVRANIGAALLFGVATAFNVVNTLYLQDVLDWTPLETGLAFTASSLVTALVGPRAGALASRVGADALAVAGAMATVAASLVFLRVGTSTDLAVILAARLLAGLGFAFAYPSFNIQALTGVRDDEHGLASGLVGSSFQIGGAIVLAITTAVLLGATPEHATAEQVVGGFKAGVYVTLAAASLLLLMSLGGLLAERRRAGAERRSRATPIRRDLDSGASLRQAA